MSEPVSKHDANQGSKEYTDTLKTLFEKILYHIVHSKDIVDNKVRTLNSPVTIKFGTENVYKSFFAPIAVENRLNQDNNIQQLQTALTDLQNLKGSVTITLGREIIFQAENGVLHQDKFQIASQLQEQPQQSQEQSQQSQKATPIAETKQEKEQEQKPNLESIELTTKAIENHLKTHDWFIDSIKQLPASREELQRVQETLKQQQATLDSIITQLDDIVGKLTPKTPKLQNWLGEAEAKLKDYILQLRSKVKEVLTPRVEKMQQQIESRLSVLEEKVGEVSENLQTVLRASRGKELVQQTNKVLAQIGKYNLDGSIQFVTSNYIFAWKDKCLSVTTKVGGREVLNDSGFTALTTSQDVARLENIEKVAQDLQVKNSVLRVQGLKMGA